MNKSDYNYPYNIPDKIEEVDDNSDSALVRNIFIGIAVYVVAIIAFGYVLSGNHRGTKVYVSNERKDKVFLLMNKSTKFSAYDPNIKKFHNDYFNNLILNETLDSKHVAVSPDGQYLAICRNKPSTFQIEVMQIDNGRVDYIKTIFDKAMYPGFTYENLLFYISKKYNNYTFVFNKNITNTNDGVQNLETECEISHAQYSESLKKFFFLGKHKDDNQPIYSYDPKKGSSENLVVWYESSHKINSIAVSPIGDKIALLNDKKEIIVLTLDETKTKIFETNGIGSNILNLDWSNDNLHLNYLGNDHEKKDTKTKYKTFVKSIDTTYADADAEHEIIFDKYDKDSIWMWRSF